jgi:antitoxin (DNA-binding transcriptional repressor) of toxin-antitoxin stability system
MAENLIIREPVFIEDNGQPVAVILPIEDYAAFRKWKDSTASASNQDAAFECEKAAFERLKPRLLQQYHGKCVAIVNEEVVEVGDDKLAVLDRVHQRFGRVPVYVQWVTDQPRVYHLPHRRIIRS